MAPFIKESSEGYRAGVPNVETPSTIGVQTLKKLISMEGVPKGYKILIFIYLSFLFNYIVNESLKERTVQPIGMEYHTYILIITLNYYLYYSV